LPLRAVTREAVDPVNAAIAYVAFSGFFGFGTDNQCHIFKTVDFGQTWTDISTNLPNNPVNDVLIDPDLIDNIYAATDIGVFRTASGGDSWSTLSSGLPRVTVEGLAFHRPSRTLRAATHGRGVWDLQLPLLEASRAPVIDSVSPPALTVTVNGANFFPGSIARWNGYDRPTAFVSSRTLLMTLSAVDLSKAGRNALLVFNRAGGQGNSNLVSFDVGPAPGFAASGLVSAASRGVSGVLVPGSFSSLYGTNLAAETVLAADNTAMPTTALPSSLGGVVVNVDGDPAPLLFVSPTQINFQAPWFLRFYSRAILTVTNGFRKTSVPVDIVPYLPAIFTLDWSGGGQGLINVAGTDGALAAPEGTAERARPAQRGESVEIFCSGLGPVSRTPGDGNLSPGPPLAITRLPEVTIGGVPATVAFSGLTPGRVGIYQVTVQVPEGVPAGDSVPVSLTIANVGSNTVTIAVR
ncbi:MAG: hypothetical protein HYR60_18790, partial [Acidobacteria bacterium]|nr:hypothetical protein [Acidobacteriota bacterium]